MKSITYVTSNWFKILSAKEVLEPLGFKVEHIKMDTTEIQADKVEEIAMHSAKEASDKLKKSVLKNDTGLFIEALNGFPGPYTHYVGERLGEEKILKLQEMKSKLLDELISEDNLYTKHLTQSDIEFILGNN